MQAQGNIFYVFQAVNLEFVRWSTKKFSMLELGLYFL